MDKITLFSNYVELSETSEDENIIAKFVLCDFDVNKNKVKLNRETIESWFATIINQPLVGKIVTSYDGSSDFSGHNMKIISKIDKNGNLIKLVEFDTNAFGTFISCAIEEINGIECITATAEIWRRYPKACQLIIDRINSGTLYSSWEILVSEAHLDSDVKVIDNGKFTAHCILGKNVSPAYDSSRLLEVAEENSSFELFNALSQDIALSSNNTSKEQEENILDGKKEKVETTVKTEVSDSTIETPVDKSEQEKEKVEQASLTEWDLRKKLRNACRAKLDVWCYIAFHFPIDKTIWVECDDRESELDFVLFTYEVTNDEVTLSEPQDVKLSVSIREVNNVVSQLEQKDDALVKANEKIQELSTEIANLTPFKEACEKAEQEKIEAETAQKRKDLLHKIEKSNLFTTEELESAEIKQMIENIDESGIKNLMADKFMASLETNQETTTEVSEAKENIQTSSVKADIVTDEDEATSKDVIKAILG